MYSLQTSLIILGMVITGTARSVGVKVFYQLGFDNYLLVALLYLLGQSLSLLVYFISKFCSCTSHHEEQEYAPIDNKELDEDEDEDGHSSDSSTGESGDELSHLESQAVATTAAHLERCQSAPIMDSTPEKTEPQLKHARSLPMSRRGSKTGLTEESQEAVAWVHSIPWQLKPLIPGLFNLVNAALKWASFVFVAASIAEMLMSGLELVLSVMVARLVRKRQISSMRWTGVLVVAVGLATVHAADLWDSGGSDGESRRDHWIGALLIVGQCVTAVGQDIAEELFLQEADFPATLLLGMEGIIGLLFGIPLYLQYSPEAPLETLANLQESNWKVIYLCFLVLIFTVTGIFNIMTTGVTSSMTRNMWKNCRTLMVWVTGLIIFYGTGDDNLGEEWIVPDSFFVLGGFLIMLSGIYVYYKNK